MIRVNMRLNRYLIIFLVGVLSTTMVYSSNPKRFGHFNSNNILEHSRVTYLKKYYNYGVTMHEEPLNNKLIYSEYIVKIQYGEYIINDIDSFRMEYNGILEDIKKKLCKKYGYICIFDLGIQNAPYVDNTYSDDVTVEVYTEFYKEIIKRLEL